jgi:hypothetical protein
MIKSKRASICLLLFIAVNLVAINGFAGLIDCGVPYNDGTTVWEGSTAFQSVENPNLWGHVDWAVFAPGAFTVTDPNFTPIADEFTYVYQIFAQGTDDVSDLGVSLLNSADNIGYFAMPGVAGQNPIAKGIDPLVSAEWIFAGLKLPTSGTDLSAGNSVGLAYSSSTAPIALHALILDGGT